MVDQGRPGPLENVAFLLIANNLDTNGNVASMSKNLTDVLTQTALELNNSSANLTESHNTLRAVEAFAVVLMSLLIVVAFQGNLWIVIVILVTPQLRSSLANIFIINLCSVDLLASVIAMPLAVVTFVEGHNALEKVVCEVSGFFSTCVMVASMLCLCAISIERFYSIAMPMHHAGHATPCLYILVVAAIWFISLVLAVLPWFGVNSYRFRPSQRACSFYWQGGQSEDRAFIILVFIVSFLIPSVILITMYIGIFRVARKAATTIAPHPTGHSLPLATSDNGATSTNPRAFQNHSNTENIFTIPSHNGTTNGHPAMAPQITVQEVSPNTSRNFDKEHYDDRRTSMEDSGIRVAEVTDSASMQSRPSVVNNKDVKEIGSSRNSVPVSQNRRITSRFLCACGKTEVSQTALADASSKISDSNPSALPSLVDSKTVNRKSVERPHAPIYGPGRVRSNQTKAFKTLMIIVISYLLLWGPYFVCQIYELTNEKGASHAVELSVTWLTFTSYAVNPCLYGCMNRTIREELSQLLKSVWKYCLCWSCCIYSQGRCRYRRPCRKLSDPDADLDEDGENADDMFGGAESFYQFLQRTQASDVTNPVVRGNQRDSVTQGGNDISMDLNSGPVSAENQSNCVF